MVQAPGKPQTELKSAETFSLINQRTPLSYSELLHNEYLIRISVNTDAAIE